MRSFLFLLLLFVSQTKSEKIGFFDFSKANSTLKNINSQEDLKEKKISQLAAAVFEGEPDAPLPDEVTICVTIYIDLDDAGDKFSRVFPTWAFVGDEGQLNLTLRVPLDVHQKVDSESISLYMESSHKVVKNNHLMSKLISIFGLCQRPAPIIGFVTRDE